VTQAGGRCAFCGDHGLTKGHVWPDWLNRILPKSATHHEQETGKFNTFEAAVLGPKHVIKVGQGHARSRKPRNGDLKALGAYHAGDRSSDVVAPYFRRAFCST
jgi:hypothetical protein